MVWSWDGRQSELLRNSEIVSVNCKREMIPRPISAMKKAIEKFGSFEARRAEAYLKNRSGYSEEFLPPRSSPIRYKLPKTMPPGLLSPKQSDSPTSTSTSPQARWKEEMAKRRKEYLAQHYEKPETPQEQSIQLPKTIIKAPVRAETQYTLPSIASATQQDFQIDRQQSSMEANRRAQRRANVIAAQRETRLSQFLNIHHHAANFITTSAQLDRALDACFDNGTPSLNIGNRDFTTSLSIEDVEKDIYDAILGTSAGGQPGIVEVSRALEQKSAESKSVE